MYCAKQEQREGRGRAREGRKQTESEQVRESRLRRDLVNPRGSLESRYGSILRAHPLSHLH